MSNIIKTQNDIISLMDIINSIDANEINKQVLEEILKLLLPKDNENYLVTYDIRENGLNAGIFRLRTETIAFSLNKIDIWLNENTKRFLQRFEVKDINMLKRLLFVYLVTHEIEHSCQYLMGKGIISSPNIVIEKGYKEICDILNPVEHIIPRPIKDTREFISRVLYRTNQNFYVIERNANLESIELLCQCSLYMDREDMYEIFQYMLNTIAKIGYIESTIGSFEETYHKILMYDKYRSFFEETNLSEEEKVRFGLNIKEETRKRVLSLKTRI